MKKFISIAVAGVVGAVGFASVASADASFYGRVVAGAVYVDQGTATNDGAWNLGATGHDGNNAPGSRIGFRGSQDLGSGMEAGFQIERSVNADNTGGRHNNLYLSGAWGRLTMGQQGNAFNKARNWDQTNFFGGQHEIVSSRTEGIQYSMSSGPFNFSVMAMANDENQDTPPTAAGAPRTAVADVTATPAGGFEVTGDDGVDAWIVQAGYDFGVAALNVAHYANNLDIKITEHNIAIATGATADTAAEQAEINTVRNQGRGLVDSVTTATNGEARSGTAIGVNGSAGPLDWYLAYQTSELNTNAYENDVDSVGGFLGFKASEDDTFYAYHVSHSADRPEYNVAGDEVTLGEDYTESVFGYSRVIGPGVIFIAEYQDRDLDIEGKDNGSDQNRFALAVKYDF